MSLTSSCGSIIFFLIFFYDFIIQHFFLNSFVVIFNFFSIGLSCSHGLDRGFCIPVLCKGFCFLNNVVCIHFLNNSFYFIQMSFILYKNIYYEIIFLIYLALHNFFPFILFNKFCICFCFYYLLLVVINKFSRHKQVNILFCKIRYLG